MKTYNPSKQPRPNTERTNMTDTQILQQLLNGYHLSNKELRRAKKLVRKLSLYLNQQ